MSFITRFTALTTLGLVASIVQAQLSLVSRSSTVTAGSLGGPTNSASSANFLPFDQSVSSSALRGGSTATQHSWFTTAAGNTTLNWSTYSSAYSVWASPMQGGPGAGNATNQIIFTFDVASPADYSLAVANPQNWYAFHVRLSRISGQEAPGVVYEAPVGVSWLSVSDAGTISPGRYEFRLDLGVGAGAGAGFSLNCSGTFTVTPAPGPAAALLAAAAAAGMRRRR